MVALYKQEDEPSLDALNIALFTLSALNLIIFLGCLTLVLVKTRGDIYYRMGFIYAGYLICQVSRLLLDSRRVLAKDGDFSRAMINWLKVLNSFATRFKWFFVYYFVIIVRDIKLRLAIEDPKEFGPKIRRQRVFNNSILVIFIIFQTLIIIIHVLQYLVLQKVSKVIEYSEVLIKIIALVIEFIMAFILMDIVRFYIRKKHEKERAEEGLDVSASEDNRTWCFMKLPKNPRQKKLSLS